VAEGVAVSASEVSERARDLGIAFDVGHPGEVEVARLAWLSPAKACFRFSCVFVPFRLLMVDRSPSSDLLQSENHS